MPTRVVKVERKEGGRLGLNIRPHPITEELIIGAVANGYPASGLVCRGEVVRAINGTPVSTPEEVIAACKAAKDVELTLAPSFRTERVPTLALPPKTTRRGPSSATSEQVRVGLELIETDGQGNRHAKLRKPSESERAAAVRVGARPSVERAVQIINVHAAAKKSGRFTVGDWVVAVDGVAVCDVHAVKELIRKGLDSGASSIEFGLSTAAPMIYEEQTARSETVPPTPATPELAVEPDVSDDATESPMAARRPSAEMPAGALPLAAATLSLSPKAAAPTGEREGDASGNDSGVSDRSSMSTMEETSEGWERRVSGLFKSWFSPEEVSC